MTRIALTVDTEHNDHPARPGNTALVVDAFEQTGARGTFFLQGRWVRANPALARRIAEAGHCIGNHSRSHAPMDMMTDEGIADSLATAEEELTRLMVEYDGDVQVADDGTLIYVFEDLLVSAEAAGTRWSWPAHRWP